MGGSGNGSSHWALGPRRPGARPGLQALHAYTITCVWLSGKQVGTLAVLYRQTTPEMLPTVQAASGPFQARLQVGLSEQSAPRALEP